MKKIIIGIIGLIGLLIAQNAFAAIAFDAASAFNTGTNATSTSVNITVTSTINEILFVCGLTTSGNSSATYNGVPMTQVGLQKGNVDNRTLSLFVLPQAASGTHSILLTTTSTSALLRVWGSSYIGALQSSIVDASSTNNTSSNIAANTSTLTSITTNDWGVLCERASGSNGTSIASGTNAVARTTDVNDGIFDTNSPQPAGTINMSTVAASGTFQWYGVMGAFAPFTSSNPTSTPDVTSTILSVSGALNVKGAFTVNY